MSLGTPRVRAIPSIKLEADGSPLPSGEALGLGAVRVQQALSAPTLCELAFFSPPGRPAGVPALTPGTSLRVNVGDAAPPLFAGEVTAVEYIYGSSGQREVRVRAYDLLHRLRKRQTVRVHVQVSLLDVARQMASGVGLQVEGAEPGPLWRTLYQHRQSDLGLLVETAERCGLYLTVRDGTLHLITLDGTGDSVSLALGESLLEARIEVNGDTSCRTVSASGWDAQGVEAHDGQVSRARVGRQVRAEASPDRLDGRQRYLVGEALQDDRHAEALAQSELDLRTAREVTLWGIAEGDPRLRPGTPVEVDGVAPDVAGRYVLASVVHTVDDRMGFVSEISSAPPAPRPRPEGASVAFGVVTQVNDPEELGRVKISLPTYGDVETDWMEVLCVAAGQGKGLVALPDVGDKVLVAFSHEDPGQGVVLGGLYGKTGPPDPGVEGGAVKRFILRTSGGSYVQFDDGRNTVRLQDQHGSYLELSPDTVLLHAVTALEIEAPGKPVTIRGQTVDFERA
jgi:uncharacterized protein involved in type VI secretion and phage assembly